MTAGEIVALVAIALLSIALIVKQDVIEELREEIDKLKGKQ